MIGPNKIVQVPMEEELLGALNELSKARASSRSAIIRRACREYVHRVRQEALDDAYERGYRHVPEEKTVGEAQAGLAGRVLPEESW